MQFSQDKIMYSDPMSHKNYLHFQNTQFKLNKNKQIGITNIGYQSSGQTTLINFLKIKRMVKPKIDLIKLTMMMNRIYPTSWI